MDSALSSLVPSIPLTIRTPTGRIRKLYPSEIAFVEAYLGDAGEVHTEAARIAGISNPSGRGLALLRRLREVIEQERARRAKALEMPPEAIIMRLALLAKGRYPVLETHDDLGKPLKKPYTVYMHVPAPVVKGALDTLARINGLLESKLEITLDRSTLARELRDYLRYMRDNPDAIDVESKLLTA